MENRKYVDCRDYPGQNCSLKISGTEDEVVKASVEHAVSVHGQTKNKELEDKIRMGLKDESDSGGMIVGGPSATPPAPDISITH